MRRIIDSSNGLPTICKPIGKPPFEKPQGNEIAGRPARLKGIVNLKRATVAFLRLTMPFNLDRKSTRLNSSHGYISYAVFCLKKKKIRPPFIVPLETDPS